MKRKATDVLADVFIYVFMAVLSLLCLIPVSYTHLDVYKRQGFKREKQRFILRLGVI